MCAKTREEQIAEAEELLSDRLPEIGFTKGLYFGRFLNEKLLQYPHHVEPTVAALRTNFGSSVGSASIPWRSIAKPRFPMTSFAASASWGFLGHVSRATWAAAGCRRHPIAG